ncbi:helix-turn-helix domain-containing protein [Herpetosiphon llansteffanensis]|uniref:helix-turn-helix domain-containing protein n=1 Tax=Herpetosiphon llansteffanensis TaxID=2094568 RepID=UPI000D7BF830|nr:helix-turn-helix transcriptional regulator [Herpetosiphon llansteffanensis]
MIRWRLREIAEPERWNIKKLSEKTGLAYKSVYAIWKDTARRVDLDTLDKLASILNVQPGDLFAYIQQCPIKEFGSQENHEVI